MLQKTVGYFTPAKSNTVNPCTPEFGVVEETPSVYISSVGHVALGVIYSIFLFGYAAFLIYEWTQRPEYYQYAQRESLDFAPVPMRLYAYCTDAPNCGDLTVTQNYAGVPGCDGIASISVTKVAADTAQTSTLGTRGVDVAVCFSGDPLFNTHSEPLVIPGVTVSFSNVDTTTSPSTQGVVYVSSFANGTQVPFRLVNMDRKQVKSLVVSQTVQLENNEFRSRQAVPIGIQYDGKHASNRATFILAAAPYVDTINQWRDGWLTIIGTLGSCAMAAWVVFVIMLVIIPVWPCLFPSEAQRRLTGGRR